MRDRASLLLIGCALLACAGPKPESKAAPSANAAAAANAPVATSKRGNPRDDLIPRQVLFGNPERINVQISPDGRYLSWLAPSAGVLNVWVAEVGDLAKAKVVTSDKQRPVRAYFWTFDRKHLLYLQDTGGDENFHLHRVDVTTGEVIDLTPIEGARVDTVRLSERKPNLVIAAINDRDPSVFDLYRIDLARGERTRIVENQQQFLGFDVDHDLNPRMGLRMEPDGSTSFWSYDQKARSFRPYDRVPHEDAASTEVLGFDKLGGALYLLDSRGRDTAALYRQDVKTKQKKLLHEDARADIGSELIVHPTEHAIQAVQVEYEKPRWVALDQRVEKDLKGLASLGEGTVRVVSKTLDDKTWIVLRGSDREGPKYYRWDRPSQRGTFLFAVQPALDQQPLVPMQPVTIEARDGLSLVSYLSLPKGADADGDGKVERPLPMVLVVHGGPWARDRWSYNGWHQLLANRGYAVLSVNYRGSTGFGKRFLNAGNMEWGKKMHDDLLDAVSWAVAQGVTSKETVGILGGSYGGYATLSGLALTPDTFACGVDLVGISNIVTFIETVPSYWKPALSFLHSRVGNPNTEEGKRALLEVSPLTHAGNIERPLLIAQGKNDPRVKKSESDQIVEAMKAKQIPVSYIVFPDEGHGFARPENNVAFFAVAEAFLSVHLGGSYQPITSEELSASSLSIEHGRESLPGLPAERAIAGGAAK